MTIKINKEIIDNLKSIVLVLLIAPAICFLYYCFVPQYAIRDHEGYLGGAVALSGYISLIIMSNIIKEHIYSKTGKVKNCIYIISIIDVLAGFVCIKSLLFYFARVYVFSLLIFIMLPFFYIAVRQTALKLGKRLHVNYMIVLCGAAIISLVSTVVRGVYLLRWQMAITIIVACLLLCLEVINWNSGNYDDDNRGRNYFPYDFESWKEEIKISFFIKYRTSIVITFSLVVLYMFLGPLEIYVGNRLTFSFGYKTFLPIFLVLGVLLLVFIPIVISLFTKNTYKIICIVMTSFSLLSYIQCMIMNTKLMEDDGARLRLDTMGNYPQINLALWLVISMVLIFVLYLSKEKWNTISIGICAFISAVQMVAVVSLMITGINSPAPRYYQLTGEKMFSVAKEDNVIVLVPDSFCRKYLDEVVADDPDAMELFRDFTYYDNMDSIYHPTFPSFTHFITGHERAESDIVMSPSSAGRVTWLSEAWNDSNCVNFVNGIKKAGYHFYINIPQSCELLGSYEDVSDKVENAEYAESNIDNRSLTKMLLSMSIYRCVPYIFKPPFEYFSWDFAELETYNCKVAAYKNEDFYNEAKAGITVDNTIDNKVHIINWHGFHEEYSNDEFCNYVPDAEAQGVTRLQNSKAVFLCIKTYLDGLKAIDKYDDSTIIVMGDHGKLYDGVVMIKMPDEKHDKTVIDSTPYTYCGFQGTILDMIDADNKDNFKDKWETYDTKGQK